MDYKQKIITLLDSQELSEEQKRKLEEIFSELAESEDERIRKELMNFVAKVKDIAKSGRDSWAVRKEDVEMCERFLAYLGKQKEQKPNIELIQKSWYLEGYHDGKYNNEPKWLIQTGEGGPRYEENPKYGTQKPAECSEEDEKMFNRIIDTVQDSIAECDCDDTGCKARFALEEEANWLRNRLKSLRPQPHWKPNEEQIDALKRVFYNRPIGSDELNSLESLYNDLKKL